jgi:3-hydroxyacyl-CoA dehydrogenase
MVVANEGEHFCVGANLFLVAMAASQQQWGPDPRRWCGLPGRVPADEVRARPGGRGAVRHDARRRARALPRRDAVQAAAETYAGLVEVGVGLVPGGGGTMNMLWRALEGVPDGANVDTYES